jgi:thiol-disulfide isomerase/thioredoxin
VARDVLKQAAREFAAAKSEQLAPLADQFEAALKNLDKIGKTVEISGKTLADKDFDLKKLKGKVVLVDFWGTWCGPCVAEIPNMLKAHQKYNKRGFEIIGVARDKSDDIVRKFMKTKDLPWACINIEDSNKLIEMHEVTSYPTTLLIDRNGRVVSTLARGPLLERLLERLLPEQKE